MKRIAANYIFPIASAPIRNGYIDFAEDGTVLGIGQLDGETGSTAFYNGIICPGFTNAHCHVELSHLKDKFEEGTGMSGFINQINALRDSAPAEQRIADIEKYMTQMYEDGVSAMCDISNCDESFAFKSTSPMYTRTFIEVFGTEPSEAEEITAGASAIADKARVLGLDAAPTPHSPYTTSPELLTASAAAGLKDGFISYHNQESVEEDDMIGFHRGALYDNYRERRMRIPEATGRPAIFHFLDRLQKVHPAPFDEHVILVHNTVSTEECVRAAQKVLKNCWWVTCPLSNIFIHRQIADLRMLMRMGAKIAVGTDSLSSNHVLSMVEEIKCLQQYFPDIELNTFLEWCCLNGAAALGKDAQLGTFEAGKKPGAVLIDAVDFDSMKLTAESRSRRLI